MRFGSLIALCMSSILVVTVGWGIAHAAERQSARYHQPFTLYGKEKKDPYTIWVPIQLTRTGLIRASIRISPEAAGEERALRLQIMDVGLFDRKKAPPDFWNQLYRASRPVRDAAETVVGISPLLSAGEWMAEEFVSNLKYVARIWKKEKKKSPPPYYHGGIIIERQLADGTDHAVDQPELVRTEGKYLIMLDNFSPKPVSGEILIDYPGDEWNVAPELEQGYEVKPDLAVESVSLDAENRVVVTIAGIGKRPVPSARWNDPREKSVLLSIRVDGKERAAIPLATFDPAKTLSREGRQMVRYTTDLVVDRPMKVDVRLDPEKRLSESSTRNNNRSENLAPGQLKQRHRREAPSREGGAATPTGESGTISIPPDLAVTRLWLDERRRVTIEVTNRGGGLPAGLWGRPGGEQPAIRLEQDGKSWVWTSLSVVDSGKRLTLGNSSVTYTFPERLSRLATITAIIDPDGKVEDADRSNNSLSQKLQPR